MSSVRFWKMHGIGNDYILIDNRQEAILEEELPMLAQQTCQRRFSIGADGLLLLSTSKLADVRMRIFNSDGSEAEMCGNGIRCLAKYCYDSGVIKKQAFVIDTLSGLKQVWLTIRDGKAVSVRTDMGQPLFQREEIPMRGDGRCINEPITVDEYDLQMTCLSVGNPHCVIFVEAVDEFPVQRIGSQIEHHKLFPNRVNVEFVQMVNSGEMRVRVWERGVGETLACGTGACAAAVASNLLGRSSDEILVHLLGGDLTIKYAESILMTGPAEKVFEGILSVR
ncbi:MAG: diaminopimelate epimerase [Candidatus Bathyarchaeota archaeon]|nr:MAG: diaminopimelate epimerase [Candidatus Bathyarchaeota archaeon]